MTDTPIDVAERAAELEGKNALEILRWASRAVPKLTFATAFGPEGGVVVDLVAKAGLPIDVFTLDTGVLFPETYALWRALETRYGVTIRAVRPEQTIEAQSLTHGSALWERDPDRCCDLRKVRPLRAALTGFDAWITGIRREQTPERRTAKVVEHDPTFGLLKINPLVGWTNDEVWAHIYANDVPYHELHDRGYPSIGCQPCTSAVGAGEDARAGRWRGAAKKECGLHVLPSTGHGPR